MIVVPAYKPWTPAELPLPPWRFYTEADTKAMADYICAEEDKRVLAELMAMFS